MECIYGINLAYLSIIVKFTSRVGEVKEKNGKSVFRIGGKFFLLIIQITITSRTSHA